MQQQILRNDTQREKTFFVRGEVQGRKQRDQRREKPEIGDLPVAAAPHMVDAAEQKQSAQRQEIQQIAAQLRGEKVRASSHVAQKLGRFQGFGILVAVRAEQIRGKICFLYVTGILLFEQSLQFVRGDAHEYMRKNREEDKQCDRQDARGGESRGAGAVWSAAFEQLEPEDRRRDRKSEKEKRRMNQQSDATDERREQEAGRAPALNAQHKQLHEQRHKNIQHADLLHGVPPEHFIQKKQIRQQQRRIAARQQCFFCQQRLHEAKQHAGDEYRDIQDHRDHVHGRVIRKQIDHGTDEGT